MRTRRLIGLPLLAAGLILSAEAAAQTEPGATDPRIGLAPGVHDAGVAAHAMELVAHEPKPDAFVGPGGQMAILFANSDLAFRGDLVFVGNFHGFNVYDVSDPENPTLRTSVVCPGGQGDLSVHGDLLFMSVEMPNGRVDCEPGEMSPNPDPNRFRGVRIWDIGDLDAPEQVAAIQTCRGSHTHTLVTDPNDAGNVYVYVSGTSYVRPEEELAGCVGDADDPESALFRIEVIKVPLDAPETAAIVSTPRIFADRETGEIAGLWEGGRHGPDTQETERTDMCHDITAYPEIGLAAGACSGNGILLDISDPANPVRVDEVIDPNFAYWHSATWSNDGETVIFTDEWGGGTEARCRESDPRDWGANALFSLTDDGLELESYYKLPPPQTPSENCVAHNGSLVPVPGRDIMVQSWYQGGVSVFDFTDPASPVEIAYFDRGPMSVDELVLGGQWSSYWYNGLIYGSEIGRGLDVLRLVPSEHLTENEIEAANQVRFDEWNAQTQQRVGWPAVEVVARALLDQLARDHPDHTAPVAEAFEAALAMDGDERGAALVRLSDEVDDHATDAEPATAERLGLLAETLRGMAGS